MNEKDKEYLKLAIENSRKSMAEGNFPAGALVVQGGEILSSEVSSPYPGLFHADSKAVSSAFEKNGGPVTGGVLYCSMESCLMCTSVAYWGGIRKIVYAVRKSEVDPSYYETPEDTSHLVEKFNKRIERVHVPQLETEALNIVREWENGR